MHIYGGCIHQDLYRKGSPCFPLLRSRLFTHSIIKSQSQRQVPSKIFIKAARWSQATSLNLVALVRKDLCLQSLPPSPVGAWPPPVSFLQEEGTAKGEEGTAPPQAIAAPGPQSSGSRQQKGEKQQWPGFCRSAVGQAHPLRPLQLYSSNKLTRCHLSTKPSNTEAAEQEAKRGERLWPA